MASVGRNLPSKAQFHRRRFQPRPPEPLPLWVVLDPDVVLENTPPISPPLAVRESWAMVECASRKAYGCGEHGQKVLDGLSLYVRLIGCPIRNLSTALWIEANDHARQALGAEFGEGDGPPIRIDDNNLYAQAFVEVADEDHLVLTVVFRHYESSRRICYYLIYNAADESLAMVPCAPDGNPITTTMTRRPLSVRRDCGDYELVVLSQRRVPSTEEEVFSSTLEDVLCVWTPAVKEEPWCVHRWSYPVGVQQPFSAEVMFGFQGKAFFVDLSLGVMYCDLPDPTIGGSVLDFHFIPLPKGIPVDLKWDKIKTEDQGALYPDRTMGCVGGSIKLICIDRTHSRRYGDAEMTVWTLDPDLSQKYWHKNRAFPVRRIWRLHNFTHHSLSLPYMEPKCPVLMRDGTLCLLLPNNSKTLLDSADDYICSLDPRSTPLVLGWRGRISGFRYDPPLLLPSNFFKNLDSPDPIKGGIFM